MPQADGIEQREANRLERDTFDENAAADRADERERSPLGDQLFEMARLNMESYKAAHAAGFEAGYIEGQRVGHTAGYRACLDSLEARIKVPT